MTKLLLTLLVALWMLLGCSDEKPKDISDESKIKRLVGGRYEVVGLVYAYGIRKHSKAPIERITLIPPPGIERSEIGFKIPVNPGSTITILKVLKTNRVLDPDISKCISVSFYAKIPGNVFSNFTIDHMKSNISQEEFSSLTQEISRMKELFPDISPGDTLSLFYTPTEGTST